MRRLRATLTAMLLGFAPAAQAGLPAGAWALYRQQFVTAEGRVGGALAKLLHQRPIVGGVGLEGGARLVDGGGEFGHAPSSSRPMRKRRISLVPAPMS